MPWRFRRLRVCASRQDAEAGIERYSANESNKSHSSIIEPTQPCLDHHYPHTYLPRMPESEVTSDSRTEVVGARNIGPEDQSVPRWDLEWSLGFQLPRIRHPRQVGWQCTVLLPTIRSVGGLVTILCMKHNHQFSNCAQTTGCLRGHHWLPHSLAKHRRRQRGVHYVVKTLCQFEVGHHFIWLLSGALHMQVIAALFQSGRRWNRMKASVSV